MTALDAKCDLDSETAVRLLILHFLVILARVKVQRAAKICHFNFGKNSEVVKFLNNLNVNYNIFKRAVKPYRVTGSARLRACL